MQHYGMRPACRPHFDAAPNGCDTARHQREERPRNLVFVCAFQRHQPLVIHALYPHRRRACRGSRRTLPDNYLTDLRLPRRVPSTRPPDDPA